MENTPEILCGRRRIGKEITAGMETETHNGITPRRRRRRRRRIEDSRWDNETS
jgi:hypothetical protein